MLGVGAVVEAVPPLATVYQRKLWPLEAVAVSGVLLELRHKVTLLTAGASGNAVTVAVIAALGLSHPAADT